MAAVLALKTKRMDIEQISSEAAKIKAIASLDKPTSRVYIMTGAIFGPTAPSEVTYERNRFTFKADAFR